MEAFYSLGVSDVGQRAVQCDVVAHVDVKAVLFVHRVVTLVLCKRVRLPLLPFPYSTHIYALSS